MNALARVADARTIRIEDETAKRGIKLRGGVDRCGPCPQCGGFDRFSINVKKQVWNCRGCSTGGDVIALVQALDGVGFLDAIAYLAVAEPSSIVSNIRKQPEPVVKQRDEPRLGKSCQSAPDTRRKIPQLSLSRLNRRGRGRSIRFHGRCKFGLEYHPAMVCLVRNIISNEPQGLHRTALAPDGTAIKRDGKTFRMSLGTIAGGAIKIDPDEDVTQGVCIGEGVETCLSGRQMGLHPVWSLVSIGGIEKFPILPGIEGLHICAENDANGASAKAVEACAQRWHEARRDVFVITPDVGDLNDELREAAK